MNETQEQKLRQENQRLRELLAAALDHRFHRAHDDKWVAEAINLVHGEAH